MRYRILISTAVILLLSVAAYAQTGLFGLRYGDTVAVADSLLQEQYFYPGENGTHTRLSYYSDVNKKVEAITLIIEPNAKIVVGWMILFNQENTEEEDNLVLQRLVDAHTDWFRSYEDTGQLVWLLNEGRTVHLYYLADRGLSVTYYDSAYDYLFQPPSDESR